MPATSAKPGTFCWFELATRDQQAAKKFYQSIFGWAVDDQPMGPGETYSIFRINGKDVAAGYTMRAEQRSQGMPPNWMIYVLVESADRAAASAAQLGGRVVAPPFDVMEAGRMSVISDPTGAHLCVWEPKKNLGVGLKGEHGTVVWADLSSPDPATAAAFYSDLFGWRMVGADGKPAKPGDYFHIVNGDEYIGGVAPAAHRDPHAPAHWLLYFASDNADGSLKKVLSLGGKTLMPMEVMGDARKYAIVADPQGATFGIVQELRNAKDAKAAADAKVARVAKVDKRPTTPKKPAPSIRADRISSTGKAA